MKCQLTFDIDLKSLHIRLFHVSYSVSGFAGVLTCITTLGGWNVMNQHRTLLFLR